MRRALDAAQRALTEKRKPELRLSRSSGRESIETSKLRSAAMPRQGGDTAAADTIEWALTEKMANKNTRP